MAKDLSGSVSFPIHLDREDRLVAFRVLELIYRPLKRTAEPLHLGLHKLRESKQQRCLDTLADEGLDLFL